MLAPTRYSFFFSPSSQYIFWEANFGFLELCIGFYEEIAPQAKIFGVLGLKMENFRGFGCQIYCVFTNEKSGSQILEKKSGSQILGARIKNYNVGPRDDVITLLIII